MANTTTVPLQNAYESTLSSNIDDSTTTIPVNDPPDFAVPVGKKIPAVIDGKNNFREAVLITAISGSDLTVERGKPDYDGGPSTANTHSSGAKIVITNHYGIFDDFADAIDSKLDNDGGNTTTTFDLQVSGSNFRVRKDGSDMKLTDDNQSEITLSTLAAGGGADEKIKVSSNDTTAAYLDTKFVAGDNITLTENNDGGNETMTISATSANETVTTHATYTPAFLTGGNAPETNTAIWDSVSDGEFSIDIDGATVEVTGLDFTSIASMADVASVIQAGIRAVTGSTETVVWTGGTHFVISSVDTTASSAITVTSTVAAPSGTDISGAGAGAYMDCDAGSAAAVTNKVLDPTADTGKVPALNANGNVDTDLLREVIPTGGYTAKGEILVATAADTPSLVSLGSNGEFLVADSGESAGVKWGTVADISVGMGTAVNQSETKTNGDGVGSYTMTIAMGASGLSSYELIGEFHVYEQGQNPDGQRYVTFRVVGKDGGAYAVQYSSDEVNSDTAQHNSLTFNDNDTYATSWPAFVAVSDVSLQIDDISFNGTNMEIDYTISIPGSSSSWQVDIDIHKAVGKAV